MSIDFAPAEPLEQDSIPPVSDVEYPCVVCGQEAGPYGGRGPKPKYCPEHKKVSAGKRSSKVTGAPASLAAQATGVLVQLNGIIAAVGMAAGMFKTASALAAANEGFQEQAYAALVTDQELCKLILTGGVKSAKLSLGIAYFGLGAAVLPVAAEELKEKKAVRDLAKLNAEAEDLS